MKCVKCVISKCFKVCETEGRAQEKNRRKKNLAEKKFGWKKTLVEKIWTKQVCLERNYNLWKIYENHENLTKNKKQKRKKKVEVYIIEDIHIW